MIKTKLYKDKKYTQLVDQIIFIIISLFLSSETLQSYCNNGSTPGTACSQTGAVGEADC